MPKQLAIVTGKSSYRTPDFLEAAAALRVDVVLVGDGESPTGHSALEECLDDPGAAAAQVAASVPDIDAIVGTDDQSVLTAAIAAEALGLRHNPVAAVEATRNKLTLRRLLADRKISQPRFAPAPPGSVVAVAAEIGYPVVIKPTGLAASRGVIRADNPTDAAVAENRIRSILDSAELPATQDLLVEQYIPGDEIAVEGILESDGLEILAVIDKPDPLEGPYFEETLFVTPSRHDLRTQQRAARLAADAAAALGLEVGPIHVEIRIDPAGNCYLIELAARSIGGLCGRALSFGLIGESLEVLILRSALGIRSPDPKPARPATGVLMLPIPATGTFTGVGGVDQARAISGIDDIAITIPTGKRVVALPEGDRYLGFVFAGGTDSASVESALRRAGNELTVTIDGEAVRPPTPLQQPIADPPQRQSPERD